MKSDVGCLSCSWCVYRMFGLRWWCYMSVSVAHGAGHLQWASKIQYQRFIYLSKVPVCISFLPRNAAVYAVMRCPSVYPSVTFVDSVKTSNHIVTIFSPLSSYTILVFHTKPHAWQYSDGNPQIRASSARCSMEKMTIFDQYLALSRKWCTIEP